jgi:hypothetical protein
LENDLGPPPRLIGAGAGDRGVEVQPVEVGEPTSTATAKGNTNEDKRRTIGRINRGRELPGRGIPAVARR